MAFTLTYNSLFETIQTYAEQNNNQRFIDNLPVFILFAQRRIAREVKILGMQIYIIGTFTASEGVIAKPSRWLNTIEMNYGGKAGTVYTTSITSPGTGYNFPPTITGGTGTQYQAFVQAGALTQIGIVDGGTDNDPGPFALTITPAPDDPGVGATAIASSYVGNNTRAPILPRSLEYCRFYWPNALLTDDPQFYADYDFNHWLVVPTPADALPIEIGYFQVADLLDEDHQTNWLTDNAPDLLLYACMLEAYTFLKNPDKIAFWQAMYKDAKSGFVVEDAVRVSDRTTTRTLAAALPAAAQGGPNG